MHRVSLFGALLGVLVIGPAASAVADQSAPTWNCRSTVAALFGSTPEPRFEPLVANGDGTTGADRPACADDRGGLPAADSPAGSPLTIHVQGPYSATTLTPATGAARDQVAYAGTKAADVSISTPDGQLNITATALRAEAFAHCVSGAPKLEGSSTVSDLKVNGQALPVDDAVLSEITSQFDASPFGGVLKVLVNQKIATADGLTVQAVRIELFSAAGTPQGVAVLGEAKVAKQGDTCAAASTTPPTDSGTPPTDSGTPPTGSRTPPTGSGTPPAGSGTPITGSSTGTVRPVVINGRNGGCGRVKMWIDKVDLIHRLPGHRHRATSRFGNRAVLRGRLLNCKGKPIVGAKLDQIHYVGKGVGKLIKTGMKSRGHGKLTLILPMNLTTRTIVIAYRPNLASKKVGSRVVLHLTVHNRQGKIMRGRPPASLE